jgi:protein disulfide-isomerase A6
MSCRLPLGARTAQGLVDAALREVNTAVKSRLSGKSSGGGSSSGGSGGNAVVDLSESSFRKDVLDSEDLWLVAFVAPWW